MNECRALIDGREIAGSVRMANTFMERLKGLLFEKELHEEQGLLINPCNQVHTIGMKFNIDVVFLAKSGEVIHIEREMTPGKVSPFIKHCHQILELKEGIIEKKCIIIGKRIAFDPIYNDE